MVRGPFTARRRSSASPAVLSSPWAMVRKPPESGLPDQKGGATGVLLSTTCTVRGASAARAGVHPAERAARTARLRENLRIRVGRTDPPREIGIEMGKWWGVRNE